MQLEHIDGVLGNERVSGPLTRSTITLKE